MFERLTRRPPPTASSELAALTALAWLAMVSLVIALGGIGLSWDALNHHIYLGWVSETSRFDRDLLAASFQSYQFPYLYWPAYKLMEAGLSGVWAGIALLTLHLVLVPPLWMVARACIPEHDWYASLLRACAVALAFLGQVSLSLLDTTANDSLAAAPLVWAVALALVAAGEEQSGWWTRSRLVAVSGLAAGLAVACKLSNGPLAILMPALWLLAGSGWLPRLQQAARGCAWTLIGFLLAYGYWGWLLWDEFGNPLFPFQHEMFEPLRGLLGWRR